MTMTIAMVEAPLPADAPRQALLSEEIVVALVTAIAAGPYRHEPGICLFVDDHQLGYDASWVSPAAVDAALATLAEPLAGQAREAVAGVLAFAKADGWSLCIRTNADRKWMPGNAPEICLSLSRSDAVEASWSTGHVKEAFRVLGFALDADGTLEVSAQALAAACDLHCDDDSLHLAEIAEYALLRGGPNAKVMAA